ncbi:MAG: DUF177 domain-containing protein [Kiritimatiellaeota bacterium]|nr:DUF177 domain-containing protein [Kiritimatiellota bacterium]
MLTISVKGIDNAGKDFAGTVMPGALNLNEASSDENILYNKPVDYVFHVSEVSGGILVSGSLSTKVTTLCGRCLESFEYDLVLDDVCHFLENITTDIVDVSEDLREDILISLPVKFVCEEECAGLCRSCGVNMNKETCACGDSSDDSRIPSPWDALDQL